MTDHESKKAIPVKHARAYPYSHSTLVHTTFRASPLSKESPEQNYRGFYNLAMLLLFVSTLRLIIENYIKYGFLVSTPMLSPTDLLSFIFGIVALLVHVYVAYIIELSFIHKWTPLKMWGHIGNCVLTLLTPNVICWIGIENPLVGVGLVMTGAITFLKLISYALTNHSLATKKPNPNLKDESASEKPSLTSKDSPVFSQQIEYPKNITFNNIVYFWFVPTLCYQPSYPTTERFRKSEFTKRCLESFITTVMMFFLHSQYAAPILRSSAIVLETNDPLKLAERILKLSIVSVAIWLLMFYSFFHSFMNGMAEIMRFGDRRFYQPWWNATSIADYWRLWNIPVHSWSKRHVYMPLVGKGCPSWMASILVFFISAVFHELLIAVPTRLLTGWAFWGMMGQIPLIYLMHIFNSFRRAEAAEVFDTIGNLIFWVSFTILGQPTGIILYYAAWAKNNP